MGIKLEELLERNRGDFLGAIKEAENELAVLEARRSHLLDIIARGRAAIGPDVPEQMETIEPLTLHAAMARVLADHPDGMRPTDLTKEINDRGLYKKRDGNPVESAQIHARVGHYGDLLEKRDGRIFLREGRS